MVGRIETYLHSDSSTANKGGALIKVVTQTDFGARTPAFKAFSQNAARFAYAASSEVWDEVIALFPQVEDERLELERNQRETVTVQEIRILSL